MARRIEIPFVGGTAVSRSVIVNNQETVNFIQSIKGPGAKAPVVLETAPGLKDKGPVGNGPIRTTKMVSSRIRSGSLGDELYGVYGTRLICHTPTFGNLDIGGLNNNPGRVHMARGRNYIAMVDGTHGYTYNGTTFAQITDPDFPSNPTHMVYLDGFFIVNDAKTDNFFISAVEDPTSWNALDFEAASVAPDRALAIAATESLLWIIGDETAQAYYNSGNPDFPYEIVLTATQEVGILAPDSIAESDDGIFYLATTPEGGRFVYRINGQSGRRISGEEQETLLSYVNDPASAYGFLYKQAGKSFYVLQLPAIGGPDPKSSATLVYNINAGLWETRETNDGTAWRAGGHGVMSGRNIVGSHIQGRYYELDLDEYQDAGQEMIRRRRTQVIHANNRLMDFWSLIVDIQGGVARTPDANPLLKMRYSDDAGRTWSDFMIQEIGRIGETLRRVKFNALGMSRNRVFEIALSDAVNLTVTGAYAEVEVLAD